MRNKYIAFLLSFFFGWVWFHRFYLWNYVIGFLYLIFCWTFIPFAISIVEALYFLLMKEKEFNIKYNYDYIMKNKNLNDLQLNK